VTRFNRMRGVAAHRIRLIQRLNILKQELRHRTAELAAIEACLDEVIETEHRLMREQQGSDEPVTL
jgi:hypothetical protein